MRRGVILLFFACLWGCGALYAQAPFQSTIKNTNNSVYNYWYGNNQSLVLPLDDGGYIIKDYILPPGPNLYPPNKNPFISARITRFNQCHNAVWCKTIDSTVDNPFEYMIYHLYPYAHFDQYPAPFPGTYKYQVDNFNNGNGNYGYGNDSRSNGIIATTDSGIISCDLVPEGLYSAPPVAIKMDSKGNKIWATRLDAVAPAGKIPLYAMPKCLAAANGGCFVVFSGFNSSIHDTFPVQYICVARLDKNGRLIYSKTITSPFFNRLAQNSNGYTFGYVENLLAMPDGGLVLHIVGNFYGEQLIRLDSNCNEIWAKYIYPYQVNNSYGVNWGTSTVDSKGNMFLMSGGANGYSSQNNAKDYIQKIDKNGSPVWLKYFNDSVSTKHYGFFKGMGISKDDRLNLILGFYDYNGYGSFHDFYVKFDDNDSFNFARQLKYDNSNYANGYDLINMRACTDSGCIYLNNNNYNNTTGYYNLILAKVDKNGKSDCLGKDTVIDFYPLNFKLTNFLVSQSGGISATDSTINIKKSSFKENLVCTSHLYPIADMGGDTVVCAAKNYTMYAGDENLGAQFLWSTGDTGAYATVTKTGRYWLRIHAGYCTSTDTVNVVFKAQIKPGLPASQSICPYDSVLLKVKDSSIADFYWLSPAKQSTAGRQIFARDSGNYTLMLKGTQSCPFAASTHVGWYPLPKAKAGPDTLLCHNQVYTMQGAGGITYKWIPATYLSSETDPNAKAKLPNAQKYILVVSNTQGCHDTSYVELTVRPKPGIKASALNSTVCYGHAVILRAKGTGGDSLHYNFTWPNDGQSGDSISIIGYTSGWHKVILNDNCSPDHPSDSVYITVSPRTLADFSFIRNQPIKTGHPVSFFNKSLNASSYYWTFGSKDSSSLVSPVYIYTDTGNYKITLVAYGVNGCDNDTAYGYIKVVEGRVVIFIPNIFKPDGDGLNDFFEISGLGITAYHYDIYNRWGENIFSGKENITGFQNPQGSGTWDGTFKGNPVPEGVYLYQLDVTDIDGTHHFLKGAVTVIR